MTKNEPDSRPDYTRDKAIHIAVIVICSLLIVGAIVHPTIRASIFWGLHVIAFNFYIMWTGLIDALTF